MTNPGIDNSRPADKASPQTSFTLQSVDADGVATEKALQRLPRTLLGSDLGGVLMSGGALASTARNVTLALNNTTAGFVAGAKVTVRGMHPYYDRVQVEEFTFPTANGNTTLTGSKMFRHGVPLYVDMPAGGAWVHGTVPGPWDLAPADQLDIEYDGVADSATFDAGAAVATAVNAQNYDLSDGYWVEVNGLVTEFSGRPAQFVFSRPGPFELTTGDQLEFTIDANAETATFTGTPGTVTSGNTAPFNFAPDDDLAYEVEGEAFTATILATTAASVASVEGPYDLAGGKALLLSIDGEEQTVNFVDGDFVDAGAATAAEVRTKMNAALTGSPAGGTTTVTLASAITGTASEVHVIGGDANVALQFPTTSNVGTGNVANVDAVTIDELVDIINAESPGVASDDTDALVLTGYIGGTSGLLEVVEGNIATVVDIAADTYEGAGNVADISAVTVAEAVTILNAAATGSPASALTVAGSSRIKLATLLEGGTASRVNVTGGDANDAFQLPTTNNLGTGNVPNIGAVTAAQAAALLDATLDGVADGSVSSNAVSLTSIAKGLAALLTITESGTAFAFPASTGGTGDVADINAVTPEEFQRIVQADTSAIVIINDDRTVSIGHAVGAVADKIQVMSTSEVEVIMGLDTSVHAVGGVTIGCGAAVAVNPPARWVYCNATGTLVASLARDADGTIRSYTVDAIGPVPLAIEALHTGTDITDMVPIV